VSGGVTRLHVVGCHRSGTTLITELIDYGFVIDARADHEQALWEPVPAGEGIFLTKKPPDTIRIRRAFLLDPDLFVVAMIRDPRGVITSRHPSFPDVYFSSFWRWEQYARAIEALHGHPRCVVVRYEDLVADQDDVQDRLAAAFAFLQPAGRFSRFPEGAAVHENAGVSMRGVRAIDHGSLDRWRAELPSPVPPHPADDLITPERATAFVGAILLLSFYPLTEKRMETLQEQIREQRNSRDNPEKNQ